MKITIHLQKSPRVVYIPVRSGARTLRHEGRKKKSS